MPPYLLPIQLIVIHIDRNDISNLELTLKKFFLTEDIIEFNPHVVQQNGEEIYYINLLLRVHDEQILSDLYTQIQLLNFIITIL